MGWIVVFVLHLFCGMAAMAAAHSQENSTSGITPLYQEIEVVTSTGVMCSPSFSHNGLVILTVSSPSATRPGVAIPV